MAVLRHIIGTLLCTSSKLLTPPKMEVSYLDPQCCSARRASWVGLPQVEVLCEYRAGGLSCCWVQPKECLWRGNSPATVWNCFLWLEGGLQLSGRGLASQYWFQAWRSPLSQGLMAFLLPPASSLGSPGSQSAALWHKSLVTHCKAGGKCLLLKPSGAWSDQVGFITCLLSRLPLETSQVPYTSFFPAKCTLVLNHFLPLLINGQECDWTSALVSLILRLSLEK